MDELVLAPPAGMAMGSVSADDDVILITYILQMISIDTGVCVCDSVRVVALPARVVLLCWGE